MSISVRSKPAGERYARLPAEDRGGPGVDPERVADGGGLGDSGRAEDVHEQRIGAHRGIEFAPAAGGVELRPGQRASGLGVDLVESPQPLGARGDGGVGSVEEVAVATTFRFVHDDRRAAVALDVRAPARVGAIARSELESELSCNESSRVGHLKIRLLPLEKQKAFRRALRRKAFCFARRVRSPPV
jgi:hypothetical protein